jgi:hypothetical protein
MEGPSGVSAYPPERLRVYNLTEEILMDWDWKVVRFQLFNALNSLTIHDIFFVEKENNVVSISIVMENADQIRPIIRMRMIDNLIERNNPELYRQYMFCYEIWTKRDWDMLPVKKFFTRVRELHE